MTGYVDVIYDEKVRPRTDYPLKLCSYLVDRFGLSAGAKILDAGSGRGDFFNGFKKNGLDVYGLDRDADAVKIEGGASVKCCDIEKDVFPFPDNTFDAVFSKSLIEHLYNPENFIMECRRILKPGGRIILMTPDWTSTMKIFFDDYTHRQPYTAAGAKDLLDIFGFLETRADIFYQLPVLWRYPALKIVSRILQVFVPVTAKSRIKFIRWSVELMVLATGVK